MNPKLNSTVSIVKINDEILEFFKSNTRQQVRIKVENDTIMDIVLSLDGTKTIKEIGRKFKVSESDINTLLAYLESKGIMDTVQQKQDFEEYDQYRRVIHFLAEYSNSHNDLLKMWNNISKSRVMVVGLGAVGSWVSINLVQSGVKNMILMDSDTVDVTNLHRQFGYNESDIGKKKIEVLEEKLVAIQDKINVIKVDKFLDENALNELGEIDIDLIINCADKPNVDTTSLWIGEYCIKRNIPHIVGGGYNSHLSLIGQTILPYQSACVKCFAMQLEEDNKIDSTRVKKLVIPNRKVGSFGPMCSMIASMVGMESVKILSKKIKPANINRRGEFDIYTMEMKYKMFDRRDDCEWCGRGK